MTTPSKTIPDEALPPVALSARVRPDVEAAPWVCEGIKQLEQQLADMTADYLRRHREFCELKFGLAAAAGQVEQRELPELTAQALKILLAQNGCALDDEASELTYAILKRLGEPKRPQRRGQ